MHNVEYEIIPPADDSHIGLHQVAIENSPTRLTIDPSAPNPETIAKMERSLKEMQMLRKMLTKAQRVSDPHGVKAKRKTKNRKQNALVKASRKRNR